MQSLANSSRRNRGGGVHGRMIRKGYDVGWVERSETHRLCRPVVRSAVTNYRRNFICASSYFFTANLADRRLSLLVDHVDLLRHAIRYVRRRHPFDIQAIVVLPDHMHTIWTLPEGDSDFALRWRLIKSAFSHGLPAGEQISVSRASKGERGIWQRRYWEHTLRDEIDFATR